MKCWFHPEARTELIESIRYYESQQPGLGRRFLEAIIEALRRIQAHPLAHRNGVAGVQDGTSAPSLRAAGLA